MATTNPFDLLGESENDDLSVLIAAQQKKVAASSPAASTPAKLPSKPLPPAQAVRESRSNSAPIREGAGRGGFVRGRGGRGVGIVQSRDFENGNYSRYGGGRGGFSTENAEGVNSSERGQGNAGQSRGSFRGGRRGGHVSGNGEGGFDPDRPQRRVYERRSGTGMGNGMKKEGAGRGNWGTVADEVLAQETEEGVIVDENVAITGKQVEQEDGNVVDASKDKKGEAVQEVVKEPEDNEMTLEEYEKVKEEKRKALLSMKVEERKVEIDKELQSMQQLSVKKGNEEVFIKLGSDKDSPKLRDNSEKEERARKAININEFLKPAEGGRYYGPGGGRGRGRGRGDRESFGGGYTGGASVPPAMPSIEDQGQFPALGAK
ncbi:RGG repeats nuclear RNA binding protein A [Phalaenopsis equestris]|uniref:RGG repeats nuclear RNA binding protein A n=1 Tax=Phalaenopsis equestris TaxID=78828 RepID=UPI0009E38C00|nr:RGG repeats nuclear RNA binding protein A [Phalaenopsis equestris]